MEVKRSSLSKEWGLKKSPSEFHQWRSLQFGRSNGALHLRHSTIHAIRRQFQLCPLQFWFDRPSFFLSRGPLRSPAPIAIESDLHLRRRRCCLLPIMNRNRRLLFSPPLVILHQKQKKIRGPRFTELQQTMESEIQVEFDCCCSKRSALMASTSFVCGNSSE